MSKNGVLGRPRASYGVLMSSNGLSRQIPQRGAGRQLGQASSSSAPRAINPELYKRMPMF